MQSFSQEQLRDVLERAEEIQQRSKTSVELSSDVRHVLEAAEEAGLAREAVMQALQERLGILGSPPAKGDLVFARSSNGRFYAAEILETRDDGIRVSFLGGGQHTLGMDDLRPATLLPGERVVCPWPDWGFWTCTIITYDAQRQKVRVSDNWGSEHTFDLSEVFLTPRQDQQSGFGKLMAKVSWLALTGAALAGGAIGSAITWFLTR